MAKKGGLGRGLDSLFQDTNSIVEGTSFNGESMLSISDIEPDKDQPRKHFDEDALAQLAQSIAQHGILQPIVVRPTPMGAHKIVAGERRWRAARLAGLTQVPVIIKEFTNEQAMEVALIENLQREDLDPIEEAMGYKQLIDNCKYTQEQAAKVLSKSRSAVANSLRLLNLPKRAVEYVQKGELTQGHAKVILSIEDKAVQESAADEIVSKQLNVREAESLCKKLTSKPKQSKKAVVTKPALPAEVEISLREVLGTEVKVAYKEGKGVLNVSFYSDEQLKAFANLLGEYKV